MPRYAAMCQQRQGRKKMLASKYVNINVNNAGFKIKKNHLCTCFMRKKIHSFV